MKVYDENNKFIGYLKKEVEDYKMIAVTEDISVQEEDNTHFTDISLLSRNKELADWFFASSVMILFGYSVYAVYGFSMPKNLYFLGFSTVFLFCPLTLILRAIVLSFYGAAEKNFDLGMAVLLCIIQGVLFLLGLIRNFGFVFSLLFFIIELLQTYLISTILREDYRKLIGPKTNQGDSKSHVLSRKSEQVLISTLAALFVCIFIFTLMAIFPGRSETANVKGMTYFAVFGYFVTIILETILYFMFGKAFRSIADNK